MKPHVENLGLGTFPISQIDLPKCAFWDHQLPPEFLDLARYIRHNQLFTKVNIQRLDPGMKTMKLYVLMDLKMKKELVLQFTPVQRPALASLQMGLP